MFASVKECASSSRSLAERLRALDWAELERSLDTVGWAKTPPVLTPAECAELVALWPEDERFRKRVDMAKHAFGVGEYGYFAAPLPRVVRELRARAYPPLARIANRWDEALGGTPRFPATLAAYLRQCHAHGQQRPTPLLLRYRAGGFNCLHRDLYGEWVFPLQLTCFLSRTGVDYAGGEFLLVEQRPRAQSRGEVIVGQQGEIVIFPVRERPAAGKRGFYRAGLRHGVSRVVTGERFALGVIFHDAS
jgi:hypothetical protein